MAGIKNVRVLDGLVTELPFPDNTFDIVMSGHVVGDDWDNEIAEIIRVCKPGGWLVDCRGILRGI
ncbi:MAG: class I SAM-dependent methyltransferase [Clostridiales bacterium]|nr:class I SAM-dependent methyltransferase [Clostridiales bacterium]